MPPKPLFKSSRNQTVAVSVLMALFLLAATGLARLQAGNGPVYPGNTADSRHEVPQSEAVDQQHSIEIVTPAHWQTVESESGRFMAVDPKKPTRSIMILATSADEVATPVLAAQQFFAQHLDDTARATFDLRNEPVIFTLEETGLNGVQFIATSTEEDGATRQHLLACLTIGGRHFWWVYLTDTVGVAGDVDEALRANILLLRSVYGSARIVQK